MERLSSLADRTVRSLLPRALDAAGRSSDAVRLRSLPELRDAGSAAMACGTMRRVRALLGACDLSEALRLCEEAVCAAACGDAVRFGRYVREAAVRLRPEAVLS